MSVTVACRHRTWPIMSGTIMGQMGTDFPHHGDVYAFLAACEALLPLLRRLDDNTTHSSVQYSRNNLLSFFGKAINNHNSGVDPTTQVTQ